MNEKNTLERQLLAYDLAFWDTVLYLDTHPDSKEALEYFDRVREERDDAFERYDRLYGPLEAGLSNTSEGWEWVKGAWPWETEA